MNATRTQQSATTNPSDIKDLRVRTSQLTIEDDSVAPSMTYVADGNDCLERASAVGSRRGESNEFGARDHR